MCLSHGNANIALHHSVLEVLDVLDVLDGVTRKKVEQAVGVEELEKILNDPSVTFQKRARCLRHPLEPHGCPLPMDMDVES